MLALIVFLLNYFRIMNNSQEIREFLDSSFLSPPTITYTKGYLRNNTPTPDNTMDDASNFSFASSSSSLIDTTPLSTNINISSSKTVIKRKLLNDTGEYMLVPHGGKNTIWEKFQTVMFVKQNIENLDSTNSPDEELTDFVACIKCKKLYRKSTGTATLNRHKCIYELKSQKTIEMYTKVTNKKKK
jgi:DNA-directed RNA polymerase subunit M/transcription elongation factor TFIIS